MLALFYDDSFNVNVLFSSNRIIDIEAFIQEKVYLSIIYGDSVPKLRDQIWERLTRTSLTRVDPVHNWGFKRNNG